MKRKSFCLVSSLILVLISALFGVQSAKAASGDAKWAKSVTAAADYSWFNSLATDAAGNIYAVGDLNAAGQFSFGNGVTATTGFAGGLNAVIVKYNSSGVAQWAKTATVAPDWSDFANVTVDINGNIYAVGYICGHTQFNFGNSATVTGTYAADANTVIVKYDSNGLAQWARSTTTATDYSYWSGVTTDAVGNIYAAGIIHGQSQFSFGNGVTVTGISAYATHHAAIVKYDSSGNALWASSTTSASSGSFFNGLTIDTSGNLYVVGWLYDAGTYGFGNNVTVTGASADGNSLMVKYNSSGTAQWAKSTTPAPGHSRFSGVTIDAADNIYVVGFNASGGTYGFGNGVSVVGASADGNGFIVKYDSNGDAQWAKSTTAASSYSVFYGVAIDPAGSIYAVGKINNNGQFSFGNGTTVNGAFNDPDYAPNAVIVKYDSNGTAEWAKSTTEASNYSGFGSVVTDTKGNVYVTGSNGDGGTYGFGNGITVVGASAAGNLFLVKYEGTGPTFATLPGDTRAINIDEGQTITTNPYTIRVKPTAPGGIDKVEFYIDDVLIGTDTTADNSGVYSYDWDTATYHSTVKVIAYDLNGYTTTLTRSTTVSLIAVASLPETGPGKTLEIILYVMIITGAGIYSFKRSKVKYY